MAETASARTNWTRWLLRDVAFAVVFLSTAGAFGSWHYLLDLCSHFRCQYLALLAVMAILLWRWKSPGWALLALAAAMHNAILVGPYYLSSATPAISQPANVRDDAVLSLVSFNVHTANSHSAAVLEYLERRDADLVLLIEVDHRWLSELSALERRYPHTVLSPQADNFGLAVYSKLPILVKKIAALGLDQPLSVQLELDWNGRSIGFLGTHPWPPMTPGLFRSRNAQLASIAEAVQSRSLPTIVAGDLNATPWCAGFRPLHSAGLKDTALGFGVQRTWNSKIPLLWIPIDHVLATPEFACRRRTVGPCCGSDHYAVEAEVWLRSLDPGGE